MTHPGETAEARTASLGADAPTLPRLLETRARQQPQATALLHKRHGIWRTWTWKQAAAEVSRLAEAIAARGTRPGDAVVIAGASGPRLLLAMLACQQAGAVPVLVPQAGAGIDLAVALTDHRPALVFAAGEHEVNAIQPLLAQLQRRPLVVCDDTRGLRGSWAPWLATFDEFASATSRDVPTPTDIAAIVYPPRPTGAWRALSHAALIERAEAATRMFGVGANDRAFVTVPLGWEQALVLGPVQWLVTGSALAFAESDATMMADLREAGASFLFGPPLLFRHLRQRAFLAARNAPWPWRGPLQGAFGPAGGGIVRRAVLRAASERLGLARVRVAACFGAAPPPQVAAFFTALGIDAREFEASAEAGEIAALESRLSGSVYIRHARVVARRQGDFAALLGLDSDSLANWAQSQGAAVRSLADLAAMDGVRALLGGEIAAAAAPDRVVAYEIAMNGFDVRAGDIAADGGLLYPEIEHLHAEALAELRAGGGISAHAPMSPRVAALPRRPATLSSTTADSAAA